MRSGLWSVVTRSHVRSPTCQSKPFPCLAKTWSPLPATGKYVLTHSQPSPVGLVVAAAAVHAAHIAQLLSSPTSPLAFRTWAAGKSQIAVHGRSVSRRVLGCASPVMFGDVCKPIFSRPVPAEDGVDAFSRSLRSSSSALRLRRRCRLVPLERLLAMGLSLSADPLGHSSASSTFVWCLQWCRPCSS